MTLSAFLTENTLPAESVKYVASERFRDPDGNPIEWEIQPVSTPHDEEIRKACAKRVPVPGNKYQFQKETDMELYLGKLAAACTIFPNLKDAALQDDRHVRGDDELLKAMLLPGEYNAYIQKVQQVCGFEKLFNNEVETAKNS